MRSRATTASWYSPRTSWSSLARAMKRSTGLPPVGATSSAAYLACLALILTSCSALSGGRVAEPPHGLAQAPEGVARDALERHVGIGDLGLARRILERAQQLEVALALERGQQLFELAAALCFESANQQGAAAGVGGIEGGDFIAEALAQNIEIAHASQRVAEPAELLAEGLRPFRDQHGAGLPQQRTQAPAGHAHLVERLRILCESRSGIIDDDLAELDIAPSPQPLDGGGRRRRRLGRWRGRDVERAQELGTAVGVGGAAAGSTCPRRARSARRRRSARPRPPGTARPRPARAAPAPSRARPRRRARARRGPARPGVATAAWPQAPGSAARPDGDEVDHLRRRDVGLGARLAGAAPAGLLRVSGQLELESRIARGSLSCHRLSRPSTRRRRVTPATAQPMVRRVQVDVGQGARGQRLAREMGEAKPRPGAELQLALEGGLHLPGSISCGHSPRSRGWLSAATSRRRCQPSHASTSFAPRARRRPVMAQ